MNFESTLHSIREHFEKKTYYLKYKGSLTISCQSQSLIMTKIPGLLFKKKKTKIRFKNCYRTKI